MKFDSFINEKLKYDQDAAVTLDKSDIKDGNIQDIIKFYSDTNKVPFAEAEAYLQSKIDKQLLYLMHSPMLNKNAIENVAASAAFGLMDELDYDNINWKTLPVDKDEVLDGDVFFDLCEYVIRENREFFPLRNPFENKSIKPYFYIAPDDHFRMNDDRLVASSQGDFTAFCTPSAQIVFNRRFSEKMCMYSIISGSKPKSKKYVSNGGDIPDHYEFIEFIIMHELLHYTSGDHFYTEQMVKKIQRKHPRVPTGMALQVLNYVGDYINNWTLVKSGYSQLPIGLFSSAVNYDAMETYEEIIDAVIAELLDLDDQDYQDMTDALNDMMDDHQESDDSSPSQGGGSNTPSANPSSDDSDGEEGEDGQGGQGSDAGDGDAEQDPDASGSGGSADDSADMDGMSGGGASGDGQGDKDAEGEGESDDGDGSGSGSDSSGGGSQGKGGDQEEDDISQAIEDAQKKNDQKMEKRQDGDKSGNTSDILNGDSNGGGSGVSNATQAAKKSAKAGTTVIDTNYNTQPINWKKVLKKMIPTPSEEFEDCYNKMSRDAISSAVTAVDTGSGRVKPGECPDDPDKKGLVVVIDNSGSVSDVLQDFNKQILKLILDRKTKMMLDDFYVIKFSDSFITYKVDVKKETFQEVVNPKEIFKASGKDINRNAKLKGQALPIRTKLFTKTYAAGTSYTPELHFIIKSLWRADFNIIFFTDDDLSWSTEFKGFYALGNKRKGSCAIFYTDLRSYNAMGDVFGRPKWVTALKPK